MAGPPTGEGPRNGNGQESNNLTRIEGIGETKAQWLKAIGITTIQDLASASADYLESRLKAEGHTPGRNEIEKKWIAQAQDLVDATSSQQTIDPVAIEAAIPPSAPPKSDTPPVEAISEPEVEATVPLSPPPQPDAPPVEATSELEVKAETLVNPSTELVNPSTEQEAWSTFAAFAVEFQDRGTKDHTEQRTIVRHVMTDTVQLWPGIEGERLKRWILGQVNQAKPSQPVTKQSATETPVIVKMGQLRLLQPAGTSMPVLVMQAGRILSNSIRSSEPFTLEVSFELVGDALADLAGKEVTYCVQWDAKNLAPPHEIISLGDTEPTPVVEGQTAYTTLLPEVMLDSGIYRLQILVILRGIAALPTFFDALVLQVV